MSSPRPGVESVNTTFLHVDDIAWTPVQRQRNPDGTESAAPSSVDFTYKVEWLATQKRPDPKTEALREFC